MLVLTLLLASLFEAQAAFAGTDPGDPGHVVRPVVLPEPIIYGNPDHGHLRWPNPQANYRNIDCSSQASIQKAQKDYCLSGLPLPEGVTADQVLQDHGIDLNRQLCSNEEEYKSAVGCILDIGRKCLTEKGLPAVLPSNARALAGISYMCRYADEMDGPCKAEKMSEIMQCAKRGRREFAVSTNWRGKTTAQITEEIMCNAFRMTAECSGHYLAGCQGRTANVYVTFIRNHLSPAVCGLDTK